MNVSPYSSYPLSSLRPHVHPMALQNRISNPLKNPLDTHLQIQTVTIHVTVTEVLPPRLRHMKNCNLAQNLCEFFDAKGDIEAIGQGPEGSALEATSHGAVNERVAGFCVVGAETEGFRAGLEVAKPGVGDLEEGGYCLGSGG
jgi:hypothetical protein